LQPPAAIGGTLKEQSAPSRRKIGGIRKALVVAQVALSLLLLIGAGLFIRSPKTSRISDPDPSTFG